MPGRRGAIPASIPPQVEDKTMNSPKSTKTQRIEDEASIVSARDKWRGADINARRLHMASSQFFVRHPQCSAAISEIRLIAEKCKLEKKGRGLLTMAGSGAGKTYLANYIQDTMPRDDEGDVSKVPTVYFKIPSAPTQRGLAAALLTALGDPRPKGSAAEMSKRAEILMSKVGTEIIFIDDIQDIPEKRGVKGVVQLGNWIRDLIDGSKCLVVMLGTFAAIDVVRGNDQLNRRAMKHQRIEYFSMTGTDNISRTKRFLDNLDKALPLAEHSKLVDSDIALRFIYATNGVTSLMLDVAKEAVDIAVSNEREHLILQDLAKAFERLFGEHHRDTNPFSVQLPRALTREDELFHHWYDTSNPAKEPEPKHQLQPKQKTPAMEETKAVQKLAKKTPEPAPGNAPQQELVDKVTGAEVEIALA